MKKLKVIFSDLHLSAGPRLPDGSRNLLEDFFEDDLLIEMIEHYGDLPDCQVDLIANGDFFNMLQIKLTGESTETITEDAALQQLRSTLAGHEELFDALREFCSGSNHELIFIIGNHDAGLLFTAVQNLLRERLGPRVQFHITYSSETIFITHGHQYEFIHNFDMKNFAHSGPDGVERLKLPWGSLFILQFLNKLKVYRPYIDKIKPFRFYLRWAFWNDHRFFWRMLVEIIIFWLRNRFSNDPYRRKEFKLSPSRLAGAMTHQPLVETAREILTNTRYRLLVFGHSHKIDYRHFGENGEYYNCGTWTEIISLDVATLGLSKLRPYVLIEYKDGQPRAGLYHWIGSPRPMVELIP